MQVFEIVTFPSDVLIDKALHVNSFDHDLRVFVEKMIETMYAANGIGLAAPQVSESKRIIVIDPSAGTIKDDLVVMINPNIVWKSKDVETSEEGCLSLPGFSLRVSRSLSVEVEYQDLVGQTHHTLYTGLSARIVQHEIDHLDGVLMTNRVGVLERKMALKNVDKKMLSANGNL